MADRPNEEITVAFPGGKTVATPTDENGSWKVDVPSGAELKPSDGVTMTDVTGNKSAGPVGIVAGTCAATVVSIPAGTLIYVHFVPKGDGCSAEYPTLQSSFKGRNHVYVYKRF